MNETILILSSEPIVSLVFQETLEYAGYTVWAVGDLGTAVDRLRHSKPDLLIIRPYVEHISGHDAATFLRAKCHGLRVLVVAGLVDDDRLQNRMSLGKFHVFPKPFSALEFLERVKDVLSHK